jgi:hypothetical protein
VLPGGLWLWEDTLSGNVTSLMPSLFYQLMLEGDANL